MPASFSGIVFGVLKLWGLSCVDLGSVSTSSAISDGPNIDAKEESPGSSSTFSSEADLPFRVEVENP